MLLCYLCYFLSYFSAAPLLMTALLHTLMYLRSGFCLNDSQVLRMLTANVIFLYFQRLTEGVEETGNKIK